MANQDLVKIEIQKLKDEAIETQKAAQKAREKLEEAEYQPKQAELEPLKELVIKAHSILCKWNHTDGCGLQYE